MSNNGVWFVNLGKDPEPLTLGGREIFKLRCAEKASSKKATTRWFSALVGGPDVATAARLAKGDSIAVSGEMSRTEYAAKKPRYRGEVMVDDEIPFAKIVKVLKSQTFFAGQDAPVATGEPTADAPAGDEAPDITPPDLEGL